MSTPPCCIPGDHSPALVVTVVSMVGAQAHASDSQRGVSLQTATA